MIRLHLSEADIDRTAPLLPGPAKEERHSLTFFDTPGHDLAAAGITLTIRHDADRRIQRIRQTASGAAGPFICFDRETLVEGDFPVLDAATPVEVPADALSPLFTAAFTRRKWLSEDGVEVALDRGEVSCGGRIAPILEYRIGSRGGDVRAAHDFARRLGPLPLGVLTMAERGYLLTGPQPDRIKAENPGLHDDMTSAQAFRQIAQSCIRQFRQNEDLLRTTRAPEPLHQARVALRRLRSAFSIFAPMLGDAARPLRDDLRWLAGELGPARDLDVLLMGSADKDRIRPAREAAHDDAARALASDRARLLMIDLSAWLADGEWLHDPALEDARVRPARAFAKGALGRFRRKVKKDGRGLVRLDDDARHEVRKDAKKLRYAVDFFGPLFKGKKPFLGALEDLQENLGTLNDLSTAPPLLERLGLPPERLPKKKPLLRAASAAYDDLTRARRFWR